jgi:hypothetical protein
MWALPNFALNALFDLLLWPLGWLPESAQIALLGLPAAIGALLVYRHTSNQSGIERSKDRVQAHLLELRLFGSDLGVSLRSQGQMMRHIGAYMAYSLVPLAVMIVPFSLAVIQMESRFAYRGLEPGESTLLAVVVDSEEPVSELDVSLSLPKELLRETPALRIDSTGEIVWRIRAQSPGDHRIEIGVDGWRVDGHLLAGSGGGQVSTSVYRGDAFAVLAYPGERSLPVSVPVRSIHVTYPRRRATFAGLSTASWLFVGSSILFGFAVRGRLGVTF